MKALPKMGNDEVNIYLRLNEKLAKFFSQIKKSLGVKNNTEVLRLLIRWYYSEHIEKVKKET